MLTLNGTAILVKLGLKVEGLLSGSDEVVDKFAACALHWPATATLATRDSRSSLARLAVGLRTYAEVRTDKAKGLMSHES